MEKSENQLAKELTRYYEQKSALIKQEKTYNNALSYERLLNFYEEKINSLRKQLNARNPFRLQKIDTQRANNCTVKEAVEITSKSV